MSGQSREPRLRVIKVEQSTVTKIVRAIGPTKQWRLAAMEYARKTEFGKVALEDLPPADLAPILKLVLKAVADNVEFAGQSKISDLAEFDCPAALTKVLQHQVRKVADKMKAEGKEPVAPPRTQPKSRTGKRAKVSTASAHKLPAREPSETGLARPHDRSGQRVVRDTMSVFNFRRLRVLDSGDAGVRISLRGIRGGMDAEFALLVLPDQPVEPQIEQFEQREGLTVVHQGRLPGLIMRELATLGLATNE